MTSQGAKNAHQKRSRQTRDKLLNALEKLLKEKDFGDISVAEIAANAGVSTASIYRRFDKKNGFISVLFDLYLERLQEWSQSPEARLDLEGCALREALQQIVFAGWRQITHQAHIMRAIHLHGRNHLRMIGDKVEAYEESTFQTIRMLVDLYQGEIKRGDPDTTARMLAYYLNNIMMEKALFADYGATFGLELENRKFTDELADFAYGYLRTPTP